jgi:hypothetical protein
MDQTSAYVKAETQKPQDTQNHEDGPKHTLLLHVASNTKLCRRLSPGVPATKAAAQGVIAGYIEMLTAIPTLGYLRLNM